MKDLWQLKREFLEYCEIEKGQSLLTIENYDRYLTRFLKWLENYGLTNGESDTRGSVIPTNVEGSLYNKEIATPSTRGMARNDNPVVHESCQLIASLITQEVVREYRLYINRLTAKDGRELKSTTQNHHALALRAFLRYLSMHGELSLAPEKVTLAKTGDREVTFLNLEEYDRLLSIPDVGKPEGLRDKALLEVLFSTGMRVSELIALNVGQINFDRGEIAVLGKGRKLRVVFLSDKAKDLLVKYLTIRGVIARSEATKQSDQIAVPPAVDGMARNDKGASNLEVRIQNSSENESLFLSARGIRMNARGIERMISKYARAAGISKQVTPHTLRHTFATDLLSAGADIRSVQSLLGHSNLSTTQVYTHITDSHLREIHQRFHNSGKDVSPRINNTVLDTEGNNARE